MLNAGVKNSAGQKYRTRPGVRLRVIDLNLRNLLPFSPIYFTILKELPGEIRSAFQKALNRVIILVGTRSVLFIPCLQLSIRPPLCYGAGAFFPHFSQHISLMRGADGFSVIDSKPTRRKAVKPASQRNKVPLSVSGQHIFAREGIKPRSHDTRKP
jgi:hypothetical protein